MQEDAAENQKKPLSWQEAEELEKRRYEAERAASAKRRTEFRIKMFGADDPVAMYAPQSLDDYETLLGEHAAQLRNAVRSAMTIAISDDVDLTKRIPMLGVLARMIQTNLAIAKAMTHEPA